MDEGAAAKRWLLDWSASTIRSDAQPPVVLVLEDGRLAGDAPCNRFVATWSAAGDGTVSISQVARTLMLCEPATMAAEDAFLEALQAVDHLDAGPDRLALWNAHGVRLTFTALPVRDLLCRSWTVTAIAAGDAVTSVLAGTDPTVTFVDDGAFTVRTGCNTGSATWRLDGDRLDLGPLRLTKRYCHEPAGVMAQESDLATALGATARVDVTPTRLTLLTEDGRIALLAAATAGDG